MAVRMSDKVEPMDSDHAETEKKPKKKEKTKKQKKEKTIKPKKDETKPVQSEDSKSDTKPKKKKKSKSEKEQDKKLISSILSEVIASLPDVEDKVKKQILGQVSPKPMKMHAACQLAIGNIDVEKLNGSQKKSYEMLKKLDKFVFLSLGRLASDEQRLAIGHHVLKVTGSTRMPKVNDQATRTPVDSCGLTIPAIPSGKMRKLKDMETLEDKVKCYESTKELATAITALVEVSKEVLGKTKKTFLPTVDPWRRESWVYITETAGQQIEASENVNEKELKLLSYHLFLGTSLVRRMKKSTRPQKVGKKYLKKMKQKSSKKLQKQKHEKMIKSRQLEMMNASLKEDDESPDAPERKRKKLESEEHLEESQSIGTEKKKKKKSDT